MPDYIQIVGEPSGRKATRPVRTISLDHGGWEARKTPATGEVFSLDFPLYRTYRDLAFGTIQLRFESFKWKPVRLNKPDYGGQYGKDDRDCA
jgi:hypothetical protein